LFSYNNVNSQNYESSFYEICDTINSYFYDPGFKGINWDSIKLSCLDNIKSVKNEVQFQSLVNVLLSKLNTSHCFYYIKSDREYYHLLDLCTRNKDLREKIKRFYSDSIITYTDIGILTKDNNNKTFIKAIIDSTPAHKAGLLVGDRIISVDGKPFAPVASFEGKENKTVEVIIQRTKDTRSTLSFKVTPKRFNPRQLFYDGIKNSITSITKNTSSIAYIHLWAFTSYEYLELLKETLVSPKFKHAEALILDLRDGWGGSGTGYLDLFPNGKERSDSSQLIRNTYSWSKPVVLLVNSGTRSGKEILTYDFKKKNYGKIVGSTTAGAVRGGMLFFLNNGNILMVAADPCYVGNGIDLDGVGVQPDIVVNQNIEYMRGVDKQLKVAVEIANSEIKGNK
jgi:carboxyl-terminal processing protease